MKIFNIIAAICLLILSVKSIYAQQTPEFADYFYNPLVINPAYTGFHRNADLTFSGRIQTGGVEGAPETISLSYHTPISQKKMGVGGMVIHDQLGVTTKTSFYGTYAFKLFSYENSSNSWYDSPTSLSLGLVGGISRYSEDLSSLNIDNDPVFQNNVNATLPSIGVGAFYNGESFYIGVSAPNLLESSLSKENNVSIKSHYYLNSGVRFFSSRFFFIEPSILLKYIDGSPLQMDFNVFFNYNNRFELGVGYRTTSSLNILAGVYIKNNFRIVYNYNPALDSTPLGQSHGMILSYRFGDGF